MCTCISSHAELFAGYTVRGLIKKNNSRPSTKKRTKRIGRRGAFRVVSSCLYTMVFFYYRMCSFTIECVLLLRELGEEELFAWCLHVCIRWCAQTFAV